MRTVTISDELFEELKGLVVDPFDDTPDLVIGRLIAIVNKAKNRWSPLEDCEGSGGSQTSRASKSSWKYISRAKAGCRHPNINPTINSSMLLSFNITIILLLKVLFWK